jgi:methyl-accepting chemotaxis protein
VLGVVVLKFGKGDRAVPIGFLTFETTICMIALVRLAQEAKALASTMRAELGSMRELGQSGAQLADSLVHIGDARRDRTEEFQELTATWANLLIITGMVGTAGYLVTHASDFLMHGTKLDSALRSILPLAPKAFCATGLALAGAAIIGMVGSAVLRATVSQALSTRKLIAAWKQGAAGRSQESDNGETVYLANAIASAFNEKILGRLEKLPELLASAVSSTTKAVEEMRTSTGSLAAGMNAVTKHFRDVAASSQNYFGQSKSVLDELMKLGKEATGLLERLKTTEAGLASSTEQALKEMHSVLQSYEHQLMSEAVVKAPGIVEASLAPVVDRFRLAMSEQVNTTITTISALAVRNFGDVQREFERAVSPIAPQVKEIASALERVDMAVGTIGTKLRDAGPQWTAHVDQFHKALEALGDDLEGLARRGQASPGAVREVANAIENASRRMGDTVSALKDQAQLIGELEGILGGSARS